MITKLSKERHKSLKYKFQNLKTLDEKIDFWQQELKTPYWQYAYFPFSDIEDFYIVPNDSDETEKINLYCLNSFLKKIIPITGILTKITDLDGAKISFMKELESIGNKKEFILDQLVSIRDIIGQLSKPSTNLLNDSKNKFFIDGFKELLFHDRELSYDSHVMETENLVARLQGHNLAKFKKFLETLQENDLDQKTKNKKLSLPEQLLMLHYIGTLPSLSEKINNDSKEAVLISTLLNSDWQNTRIALPNLIENLLKSKRTMSFAHELFVIFEKAGMLETAQNIKNDIDRLSKKKK